MSTSPEEVMRIVPLLVMTSGVLISVLTLPLMQGKVAPNKVYGIRTKLAFSSEENWYRVNKWGGKIFFRAALLIVIIGVVGLFLPTSYRIAYSIIAAIITLGSILGAAVIVMVGT